MSVKRALSLWGPVGAFIVGIYVMAAPASLVEVGQGWDKVVHALVYAGFAVLCLRAFHGGLLVRSDSPGSGPRRIRRPQLGATIGALLLTTGYGAVDELHQMSVAGRDPSVYDWSADVVGAGLAVLAFALWAALRASTFRRAEGP